MQYKTAAAAAALIAVAGCAAESPAERDETGRITVDGTTHTAQSIDCTQIDWLLTIEMAAGPSHAVAQLQLGAEPTVQTVNITNFDGFHGVVGGDAGDAKVNVTGGTYTITGNVEGSNNPGESRTAPFEIEAPC